MQVSTIISDAKDTLGKCSEEYCFRLITDAVRLANNQGKFDAAIGSMDICVCDGCVTLPPDVGTVLGVNTEGFPTLIRDQWFQYHANGSGTQCYQPWSYTDDLGLVTTFKDPAGPVKLVAIVENSLDSNASIRVYGWDDAGKRIFTEGPNGILEDGFLVPAIYGYALPSPATPNVSRIDRVIKQVTNGFIKLIAVDATTLESETTIGYYQPWETAPSYRRIRVPDRSWIRIKYRKKDLEVRSVNDWINIENHEALMLLLKAVKFRKDNQIDTGRAYEAEGMRLLSNEAESLRPPGLRPPQIIWSDGIPTDWARDELGLHY